ncbi:MAG: UvrD-helicase domain-containing protein [Sterolibacteriaceae bacterium]|nr:UvrD-helicase domain-containing protein [Sterolibacteriaceae bacterium]
MPTMPACGRATLTISTTSCCSPIGSWSTTRKLGDIYRRLYKFICIDEAQDMNEAQYAVICALCGDTHRNVMMVGDPRQSIYGFNKSGPEYMDRFRRGVRRQARRTHGEFPVFARRRRVRADARLKLYGEPAAPRAWLRHGA